MNNKKLHTRTGCIFQVLRVLVENNSHEYREFATKNIFFIVLIDQGLLSRM